MSKPQPVRGTHDLIGEDLLRHRHVVNTARGVAVNYGYEEIATPIFEATEVFARSLGETSDVVTKEMYTFETKGGESITLRPEGTAGVARAFISNGMAQSLPVKAFYQGPMFRYERPQKGRQRQFHQVGVELLGVDSPLGDVEVIAMGRRLLDRLGVDGTIALELNTLGDTESRDAWRTALVDYFGQYRSELSEDSQTRLEKNPLRILDSKNPRDREISADAPAFADYLNQASREFFETVQKGLQRANIEFVLNPNIVRGLDYYCHTAFEFTTDALGAQGTVLAGGRYDGLIEQMGGPATPGVGWAAGVERLSMLIDQLPPIKRPIAVIPAADTNLLDAVELTEELRKCGYQTVIRYSGNMKKRLKAASGDNALLALIIGDDELAAQTVLVRNMETGDQDTIAREQLPGTLSSNSGLLKVSDPQ